MRALILSIEDLRQKRMMLLNEVVYNEVRGRTDIAEKAENLIVDLDELVAEMQSKEPPRFYPPAIPSQINIPAGSLRFAMPFAPLLRTDEDLVRATEQRQAMEEVLEEMTKLAGKYDDDEVDSKEMTRGLVRACAKLGESFVKEQVESARKREEFIARELAMQASEANPVPTE